MFSIQYRQRYKHALKLQRWPLVDTAKMEKEKKEKERQAKKQDRIIDCLIQIKISKEDSKFGLKIEDFTDFYKNMETFKNLNVIGLMGMATFTSNIEVIGEEFKMIKRIYDNVASIDPKFRVLSIGMSDDYNIAIENGSTMIRVGSKIFGKRNY